MMKNKGHVCVIGAGIIGATTAYALSKSGWKVTLVDEKQGAGMGTSFANGSQLSYSYVEPLATPNNLKKIPFWLLLSKSPISWVPQFNVNHFLWLFKFITYCRQKKVETTTRELLNLSSVTKNSLGVWLRELEIKDEEVFYKKSGKLVIYSSRGDLSSVQKQLKIQKDLGCEQEIVSSEKCLEIEPSLINLKDQIAFGVYTPSEEVIDCFQLTNLILKKSDISQVYESRVLDFVLEGDRVKAVNTSNGHLIADQFVVAAGVDSPQLLEKIEKHLLIEPIKGFSVSFPIIDFARAPKVSITDQSQKIVFARMGNILRVAGYAEIIGKNLNVEEFRVAELVAATKKIFPEVLDFENYSTWTGLRPASPSGVPYIKKLGYENLWVNSGHGALGLTLSIGSAELLATKINGLSK